MSARLLEEDLTERITADLARITGLRTAPAISTTGSRRMTRSVLIGTGSALPRRALGNEELAKMVDTSDEWIAERTGIRNRYIAGEG